MASSLAKSPVTTPDKALVSVRPQMAKAGLDDNRGQDPLSGVVFEAAKRAHGKQGAAAAQLGKDEGNFSRDVKAGRLTTAQMKALGPSFLAELGQQLVNEYGSLSDPKDHARKLCDAIQSQINELRQFIDGV